MLAPALSCLKCMLVVMASIGTCMGALYCQWMLNTIGMDVQMVVNTVLLITSLAKLPASSASTMPN